jgi:hypothetical protein
MLVKRDDGSTGSWNDAYDPAFVRCALPRASQVRTWKRLPLITPSSLSTVFLDLERGDFVVTPCNIEKEPMIPQRKMHVDFFADLSWIQLTMYVYSQSFQGFSSLAKV